MADVPLTLGVEEEYQIVNRSSRGLTSYGQILLAEGQLVLGEQLHKEVMQSQIEISTNVCENVADVRAELIRLRRSVHDLAEEHGRAIIAASTHPFSHSDEQKLSPGERYQELLNALQSITWQMLTFGMHVHVGFGTDIEQRELIIKVQNQLRYFLPHILALTASSPFFNGKNTGLKSYRSIIFEAIPRTGIPPVFASWSDYLNLLNAFDKAGSLGKTRKRGSGPDYTKIWWDSRPQVDYGTLEVRISDICTTVDEAVSIVALVQALMAKLVKLGEQNQSWVIYDSPYIKENKWRAARFGLDGKLIDWGKQQEVPMRDLARELLVFVDDVVDDLGSRAEVEAINTIIENGTSADRQLAVYQDALDAGAAEKEAMQAVVDHLIEETYLGWE